MISAENCIVANERELFERADKARIVLLKKYTFIKRTEKSSKDKNNISVPCFCITQSSGKDRLIDNGLLGRQNEFSAYTEKLALCSASQPGLVARHVAECAEEQGVDLSKDEIRLESGGEDQPDGAPD